MALPKVTVNLANGNLGRIAPSEDGISALIVTGVAVGGQFALNDILGPFNSLADAEAKGINEAYDTTNTCLAWHHIRDFYNEAGDGTDLYVTVVAKTTTMTQMTNPSTGIINTLLLAGQGKIRMVGVTRVPDGAYTPTYADQFEQDMWDAITNLKTVIANEFAVYRPISAFIEGRNWQGNASSSRNLRDAVAGPNANRISVVIGQDSTTAAVHAAAAKYGCVGLAIGRAAGIPVQRNIGRVKDGEVTVEGAAALSNGTLLTAVSNTNQNTLNDYGYIFLRAHVGVAGYYFNDDHCACVITDDYAYLNRGRTMDKAARITHAVYVNELLDDVQLDPDTGKLAPATIKNFQGVVEKQINALMTSQDEIVRVSAFCDPDQNVLATDKIEVEVNILPKGHAREIVATLAYENPVAA